MGNLRSVQKAFEKVGCQALITNDHRLIKSSSKIILPGVGAFKDGMKHLHELGLVDILNQEILHNKKPFLGICLGMQLIASKSYENGETAGLNWINAEVIKFNFSDNSKKLKIPHVGWNELTYKKNTPLFDEIPEHSDFYFVHSYHFTTDEDIVTATTTYGYEFASSIQKENIFACQFHPEKSQTAGLKLIENFLKV